MSLLPDERTLLYTSYQKIAAAGSGLTDLFYRRLFEIDPALQVLFKTSMTTQGVKFRLMLNTILLGIDQPPNLAALLHDLGRRHVAYGVKREDYPKLAESVLWAIQQYMGAEFTPEIEGVWRKLLTLISDLAGQTD